MGHSVHGREGKKRRGVKGRRCCCLCSCVYVCWGYSCNSYKRFQTKFDCCTWSSISAAATNKHQRSTSCVHQAAGQCTCSGLVTETNTRKPTPPRICPRIHCAYALCGFSVRAVYLASRVFLETTVARVSIRRRRHHTAKVFGNLLVCDVCLLHAQNMPQKLGPDRLVEF